MNQLLEGTFARWERKARGNVEKWGLQDIATILLATQEELSELAAEIQPHVSTHESKLEYALDHTIRTGFMVQNIHESLYEDDDGVPVDDPPSFEYDGGNLERIKDELIDTAALLVQLHWALEEAEDAP